jgi:hypothetical protein
LSKATTGFEPVIAVLQTAAFPLGYVAWLISILDLRYKPVTKQPKIWNYRLKIESGRWDSNPRPSPWQGDALPLSHARKNKPHLIVNAAAQT